MPTAARVARPQAAMQTAQTAATPTPARPSRASRARVRTSPARSYRHAPPVIRLRDESSARRVVSAPPEAAVASAGEPLRPGVRGPLEQSFGVDLSAVRVHSDARAAGAAGVVSARAFTHGTDIFLGKGERPDDLGLLAHEAAHVVQQQGAPRPQPFTRGGGDALEGEAQSAAAAAARGEKFEVRGRAGAGALQRLGLSDALDFVADRANMIPGYRMFTIVLGVNPINMSRVERSAANIMRAVVEFIPGGNLVTRALDAYGVFERVGAWVEQQISSLGLTGSAIRQSVMDFIRSLRLRDVVNPEGVWQRARRIFTEPIDRLIRLARGLITGVLGFLRDAVLRPLARLAQGTSGYGLLKAVLGRDPITGEAAPRNADTLIGGFMTLIGQQEVWNNLRRANAVSRAWEWFQGALEGLLGYVRQIPGLVISTLRSLELSDFLPITNLFSKIAGAFGGIASSFFSWAGNQVLNLLQIIFDVVAPSVMPYIRRAAGAFRTIIRNPAGFVRNLVRAGVQGFRQFGANFLGHLRRSLIEWLTGTLGGAGIYVPSALNTREVIKFVLSVLGLTWQNIRQKLVRAVGETAVRAMEAAFDIVMTLVTQGPAAAWEKIQEGISNLREMVMGQIMSYVRQRVVQAAIATLASSLIPGAGFIRAIIATYDTVMFFVERMRQIARVVAAYIDSISAIAAGNVGAAANRVETTMAGMLTLVISFLARVARLGDVSAAVLRLVNRVRVPIDRALDRVVDWIVAQARRLGRFIAQAGVPRDPNERIRLAARAAVAAARRLTGRVTRSLLSPILAGLRVRYGLTEITPFERGGTWWVRIVINPRHEEDLRASSTGAAASTNFTVDQRHHGTISDEEIAPPVSSGVLAPLGDGRPPRFAYVATVPTTPRGSVGAIARRYQEEGFDPPADALKRFSLVVGVNSYEDLEGTKAAAVAATAVAPSVAYPVGVFGFLWRPKWKEGERGIDFDDMRNRFRAASAADKVAIKASEREGITQRTIPMGAIRNKIMRHALTGGFVGALRARIPNVYIHVGDDDAVSLRAVRQEGFYLNATDVATALFNRYDEVLGRGRSDEELPVLASGGYRFRVALPAGGYTIDQRTLTTIASDLDMAVRRAMARVSPQSVYFPEPNTVIRVEGVDLTGLFSGGGSEGENMVRRLLRQRPDARLAFDERASIVTDSARFTVGAVSGTTTFKRGTLRGLTANQIEGMFNQAQSHARPSVWINRIAVTYQFGSRAAQEAALNDLVRHFFPNVRFGYDPATLRRALSTFNPEREPDPPASVTGRIAPPGQGPTVVRLARATGAAIRQFLFTLIRR